MQIANPIYDTVFKCLMENERIAKFFISTILDTPILDLKIRSREFTYQDEGKNLRIFRLDFLARIETARGTQKVLIEVQKAQTPLKSHVARFRKYLGEQYSRLDKVKDKDTALSIITIYILGFRLKEIDSPCFHIKRTYHDLLDGHLIEGRSPFIESLTHDCYCIQAPLIGEPYRTRLERLLSIFEQRHFDEERTLKNYPHDVGDDGDLQAIIETLYRAGSDSETRARLDLEVEAWRETEELQNLARSNAESIKEKDKIIEDKDKALKANKKALDDKDKTIEDKDKLIAQLRQKLESRN